MGKKITRIEIKKEKKRLKRDLIELYNGIDCTHKRIYSINHLLFHEIK